MSTQPPPDSETFLGAQLDRIRDWVQFGDAKAGGVLLLMGLGLVDLLNNANRLSEAHRLDGLCGDMATVLFWLGVGLAALVVVLVSRALFPHVEPSEQSIVYFGTIAKHASGSEFLDELRGLSAQQLEAHYAEQVWELSRIASAKFVRLRHAYWCVLFFLAAWAGSRLFLAIAA